MVFPRTWGGGGVRGQNTTEKIFELNILKPVSVKKQKWFPFEVFYLFAIFMTICTHGQIAMMNKLEDIAFAVKKYEQQFCR